MAYVIEARKSTLSPEWHRSATLAGLACDLHLAKEVCYTICLQAVSLRPVQSELEEARAMLNEAIEQGSEYPQRETLDSEGFRRYFLSHDAFALSRTDTNEVRARMKPSLQNVILYNPRCWASSTSSPTSPVAAATSAMAASWSSATIAARSHCSVVWPDLTWSPLCRGSVASWPRPSWTSQPRSDTAVSSSTLSVCARAITRVVSSVSGLCVQCTVAEALAIARYVGVCAA